MNKNRLRIEERDRFYLAQFDAIKETIRMTSLAADKALAKAEHASEKRLDSMNEFRTAMQDQQSTYARNDMMESRFKGVDERFAGFDKKLAEMVEYQQTQSGGFNALNKAWGYIVGVAGLAAAVVAYFT